MSDVRTKRGRREKAIDLICLGKQCEAFADWFDLAEEPTTARLLRTIRVKLEILAARTARIKFVPTRKEKRR